MKIYVTGSTSSTNLFELYNIIKAAFTKLGHEVKTPIDTVEYSKTHTDKQRFVRAMKEINEADFVISEVSAPSSGQGFELGILYARGGCNVVLISNDITKTSGVLIGAFGKPIIYNSNNIANLITTLQKKLNLVKSRL